MTLNNSNSDTTNCNEDESAAGYDAHLLAAGSSNEFPSTILDKMLTTPGSSRRSSYHLESKVDMVCGLLAMLGCQEHADMGETLLALSANPESCLAMRQSGCIPLLVQLMQSDKDSDTRNKAARAICNLISAQPDEKIRKREIKIFRLLEEMKNYREELQKSNNAQDSSKHPLEALVHLMKASFDEEHRQVICSFGGIHDLASLIEAEHIHHGGTPDTPACNSLRKYACMTLTNVTFSDSGNKALLCSYRKFMRAVVVQLQSSSEELRQVSATILRNLSWHADTTSRDMLREVGAVAGLVKAAMVTTEENTLRCILSALWNLSAHSAENKAEICAIEGALGFLVNMLSYKSTCNSMAIVENSGGILRNISSQIAVRDDYREVLRKHNCLQVLLEHLKSSNLTILNNACGIVWNLSAKCVVDQDALIKAGAADLLSTLTTSKHKMVALSASAALRNLLSSAQKRADARHGDTPSISALIVHKHQDFIVNNIDASTICDESLFFENIYEYIPMSDLKRKFDTQKMLGVKRNFDNNCRTKKPPCDETLLCQPFKNLNISASQTNYHLKSNANKPKYLPPAPKSITSSPSTYIPVRNKFSDCAFEDEIETSEEPIDYSRKYAEVKPGNPQSEKVAKFSFGIPKNKPAKDDKNPGIYAETDLDQPTDYSLQYAEDDSDSDCEKVSKSVGGEFVQDTIKTYCTEGTPYETPFNFSTATSMSDLRIDSNETRVKTPVDRDTVDSPTVKFKEDDTDTLQIKNSTEPVKSSYSSGLMSPEKPVNYCEEGTPGYFSRVSSFGSLTSIPLNEVVKVKEKSEESIPVTPGTSAIKGSNKANGSPAEAKVVKFEQVLNYAEETPLMFSRSSSLASLDSIEQHSINDDDRSSVVSDFSRRTSGVVSPSELPDSPTQMVPPSPKTRKTVDFSLGRVAPRDLKSLNHRSNPKSTVFEDKVTKFKEESTPIHFSAATSLSSLTIDDEVTQSIPERRAETVNETDERSLKQEQQENEINQHEVQDVKHEVSHQFDDDFLEQDDENDDEILAACIKMGMPSKRPSQCDIRNSSTPSKAEAAELNYRECISDDSSNLSEDDYKILAECIQAGMPRARSGTSATSLVFSSCGSEGKRSCSSIKKCKERENSILSLHGCNSHKTGLNKDVILRHQPVLKSSCSDCSDDRIARQYQHHSSSKVASYNRPLPTSSSSLGLNAPYASILPVFQVNQVSIPRNHKDGEDDQILAECIQSGMSKPRLVVGNSPLLNKKIDTSSDCLLKSKSHVIAQGRNDTHRPRYPQTSRDLPVGGYNFKTTNTFPIQKNLHLNISPRKTAIPVPTSTLNSTLYSRNSIQPNGLMRDNKVPIQNNLVVAPNVVIDPRLIHPAMEHPSTFKAKMERKHKEKPISKVKRVRHPQDLQKKHYFAPCKDEVEKYAVENSPSYVSLRSSLSDLTVDGSVAGVVSHLTSRVVSPHPEECLLEDSNDSENKEDCKVDSANSTQEKGAEGRLNCSVESQQEEQIENNATLLSEGEEDQNDDDILAACIQMGMRGKSVRGSSKSDTPKQVTDKCVTIENTGGESSEHCNSSDPLVGRLETSTAMKLSFRLKNKISKERQNVKDDTEKALETEKASVSKEDTPNAENTVEQRKLSENCESQNLIQPVQPLASRHGSLSSLSMDSASIAETEQTVLEQVPAKVEAPTKPTQTSASPKSTKRDKRSKSKRALVEKMGRVVDLLKLRKN